MIYYPPSYLWHFLLQISIFVHNFYSGVNFCVKKSLREFYFVATYFRGSRKKPAKIAKIRTRKNLVPHGIAPLNNMPTLRITDSRQS